MPRASDPTLANIQQTLQTNGLNASEYEQANVHAVYESIASHFSDTRYKPWPLIPAFLDSLPIGSVGADIGCGNGKYLASYNILCDDVKARIVTLGVDRSSNLIDIARDNFASLARKADQPAARRNEVCVGDALCTNYRSNSFDYAISIATIHHMSTVERRCQAVQEIIRLIRPVPATALTAERSEKHAGGPYAALSHGRARFLIVVWAREQRGQSRRRFEDVGEEEQHEAIDSSTAEQDLLVPWILRDASNKEVFQRFYHVFTEGELERLVDEAAKHFPHVDVRLEMNGWEKGNWYGIWRCVQR